MTLPHLIRPRSVAVIGASARPETLPSKTLHNLIAFGFEGDIYPVNPRYEEVHGLPCFPTVGAVPGPVDLALLLVPARHTAGMLAECGEAGVGAAVVFAAGFAESGRAGVLEQRRLVDRARSDGMRLLGPNCQGLIFQPSSLVATFNAAVEAGLSEPSGVAYLGQSGALGGSFLGMARERGIGVSAWFSLGNEADVTATELARALLREGGLRVIAMHLEALPAGDEWLALAGEAQGQGQGTRLAVLRSGRSEGGRRAAASHTGAMVADDAAFELLSAQHGVTLVTDVDELVDAVAGALAGRQTGLGGVAVLTSSGGAGALAADHLAQAGLPLAELSDATRRRLAAVVPSYGSTANPVDVTAQLFAGQDAAFEESRRALAEDAAVGAVLIVLTNVVDDAAVRVAEGIVTSAAEHRKPVAVAWLAAAGQTRRAREVLQAAGIVPTSSIRESVASLGRRAAASAAPPPQARGDAAARGLRSLLPERDGVIAEFEAAGLLDRLSVPHPAGRLATSRDGAEAAARELGGPVVLKVQSAAITHKTEVGGVRLGVAVEDAGAAYDAMLGDVRQALPGAPVDGILVQRRAAPGLELIVGVQGARNGYPAVVTVGLGGVGAELYADLATGVAPLTGEACRTLLARLKSWPRLAGHRGRPPADVAAVVAVLVSVSEAAVELGERLAELELNPLLVYERGVCAVDVVVRLA